MSDSGGSLTQEPYHSTARPGGPPELDKRAYSTVREAPIERLPTETLCQVFEAAVADWEADADRDWTQLSTLLMTITSVSRRWRHTAIRTPRVWRNVWNHPDSATGYVSTRTCVERSAAVPLNAAVFGAACLIDLLDTLQRLNAVGRLGSLLYKEIGPDAQHDEDVFQYQNTFHDVDARRMTMLSQFNCPSLDALTLGSGCYTGGTFRCLLENFSSIQSLTMTGISLFSFVAEVHPPISLPDLEFLELNQYTALNAYTMFNQLDTPKLSHLRVTIEYDECERALRESMSFERLGDLVGLRHVTLVGRLDPRVVRGILRATRMLETLEIAMALYEESESGSHICHSEAILAHILDDKHQVIPPHLHSLSLHISPLAIRKLIRFAPDRKEFAHRCPVKVIRLSEEVFSAISPMELRAVRDFVDVLPWTVPVLPNPLSAFQ